MILSSCSSKNKDGRSNEILLDNLVYTNDFEKEFLWNKGCFELENGIHQKSLVLNARKKNSLCIKQNVVVGNQFTVCLWFRPDFQEINGAILGLYSKREDNFEKSILQVFMNKDRLAFVQQGFDSRKVGFDIRNAFSEHFMGLEEIKRDQIYFLSYVYNEGVAKLLVDGSLYARYNLPTLKEARINHIVIGMMPNKGVGDYFFTGNIDDLYIYKKALNSGQIKELMDYTHVYQFLK